MRASEQARAALASPPRQLTARAVLTGMLLGAVLSACNIYAGLKIGWTFNMSIAAALLSYGFWQPLHHLAGTPRWGLLENNINQTTASAAASIAGAGLVAPIPALTLLTGKTLAWPWLSLWTFSVSVLGVVVAIGLRRQLLEVDGLAFPQGVATAETIKEMYAKGKEAAARVRALLAAAIAAGGAKLGGEAIGGIGLVGLPVSYPVGPVSPLRSVGVAKLTGYNLTFALDPSLMMLAFGAIIGTRAATSLLLGALVGWGWLAPRVLELGWVPPPCSELAACLKAVEQPWYEPALSWLLWPGVTMMVTASLTSFAFSWRTIASALGRLAGSASGPTVRTDEVPQRWFLAALALAFVLAVVTEWRMFEINPLLAALGVLLTFALAVVAGRVAGETGITPIGAMGQVTQLTFGVLAPGQAATNLMTANVTGGAASQCADLLHDMKTGLMIGAQPKLQAIGQAFGILAGALAGSAVYLVLVPDPQRLLLTPEFPAPAVATWKAVAEVLMRGWEALPTGTPIAMLIAGLFGMLTAVAERRLPVRLARWVPSSASIGLAFVIPAWMSLSIFGGGGIAWALRRWAPRWTERFLLVIAAGVVAGESLAGVIRATVGVLGGG